MANRQLIDYLPPFIQEYVEMKHIMSTEQPEIDDLWTACDDVLNEQFILYASEVGVKRWESLIGITPKDTDSLDERRFKILSKMNQELPYTMTKLQEALTALCGAGNFSVKLQPADYYIEIRLALTKSKEYQDALDLLDKMIPANLIPNVSIMFNTHEVLGEFRHMELSSFTHEQLRNETLGHLNFVAIICDRWGNAKLYSTSATVFIVATDDEDGNVQVTHTIALDDDNGNATIRGY